MQGPFPFDVWHLIASELDYHSHFALAAVNKDMWRRLSPKVKEWQNKGLEDAMVDAMFKRDERLVDQLLHKLDSRQYDGINVKRLMFIAIETNMVTALIKCGNLCLMTEDMVCACIEHGCDYFTHSKYLLLYPLKNRITDVLCTSIRNNGLFEKELWDIWYKYQQDTLGIEDILIGAARAKRIDILDQFENHPEAEWDWPLYWAAYEQNHNVCKWLLERGHFVDINHDIGQAARQGNEQIVNLFLEHGADDYEFAMCKAARGGHTFLVQKFIDLGARDFSRALAYAAKGGHKSVCDFLILKSSKNLDFRNAFLGALSSESIELVEIMYSLMIHTNSSLVLKDEDFVYKMYNNVLKADFIDGLHFLLTHSDDFQVPKHVLSMANAHSADECLRWLNDLMGVMLKSRHLYSNSITNSTRYHHYDAIALQDEIECWH